MADGALPGAKVDHSMAGVSRDDAGRLRRVPSSGYEEWTREAIYERAAEMGVSDRGSRTKFELIDAVRRAETL